MNIHSPYGTIIKFIGASDDQVKWGSNDDPRDFLILNETYTIDHTEIHGYHTKVILKEFPNEKFNSVHFIEIKE